MTAASAASAAAPRRPVAMSRPTSSRSAVGPSTTATISPRYMTATRSDSSRTSSSSADTSRMAAPASRLAMTWRWMNSMLPTSRPRVGWSRIRVVSLRLNSRATTAFCWLPPDSVPAVTVADGVRMSYSAMACLAQACDRRVVADDARASRAPRRTGSGSGCPRAGTRAPGRSDGGRRARTTSRPAAAPGVRGASRHCRRW